MIPDHIAVKVRSSGVLSTPEMVGLPGNALTGDDNGRLGLDGMSRLATLHDASWTLL